MSLEATFSSCTLMDALSDDDYDIVSNPGQRSLESSLADFGVLSSNIYEPQPLEAARNRFPTVSLSAEDIQLHVRRFAQLDSDPTASPRLMRIYVDGLFDGLDAGPVLQLRQAKLSFPMVHLMVGVFSDPDCQLYGSVPIASHVERCELVRHCRWVDEVVEDAPWQLDPQFLRRKQIDYVAVEEGITVDPKCDKIRLRGYDELKRIGKIIPTRRTLGLSRPRFPSAPTPVLSLSTPKLGSPVREEAPKPSVDDLAERIDQYSIGY